MIKPEIEAALNAQFNQEQAAAQEYLAMTAFFDHLNMAGFASFMRTQADEEREHALKFFDHICTRGGRAKISAIPEPAFGFDSPKAVFEAAYEREKSNTAAIHALYKLASDHGDYATQTMLHWFIDEQVEEEQWCEEAVALMEMAGDNRSAMLMLDKKYALLATTNRG